MERKTKKSYKKDKKHSKTCKKGLQYTKKYGTINLLKARDTRF